MGRVLKCNERISKQIVDIELFSKNYSNIVIVFNMLDKTLLTAARNRTHNQDPLPFLLDRQHSRKSLVM